MSGNYNTAGSWAGYNCPADANQGVNVDQSNNAVASWGNNYWQQTMQAGVGGYYSTDNVSNPVVNQFQS